MKKSGMRKTRIRPESKTLAEEMPMFKLSWTEAANIYTTLKRAWANDMPITVEETKAREGTLEMFKRALDDTKTPEGIKKPTRCACGYVFFGHDADHPPSREEWVAHINHNCKIPVYNSAQDGLLV